MLTKGGSFHNPSRGYPQVFHGCESVIHRSSEIESVKYAGGPGSRARDSRSSPWGRRVRRLFGVGDFRKAALAVGYLE